MEPQDPQTMQPRGSIPSVGSTCFVPAKQTGIATLIIQFIILLVSGMTVLFFFYHVGGYEYMGWNENSTILEPVYVHSKTAAPTTSTELPVQKFMNRLARETGSIEALLQDDNYANETHNAGNYTEPTTHFLESSETTDLLSDNETEEIQKVIIHIDLMNTTLDVLEMIRISTLAYIALGILWFLSLISLLLSIKCEVIDLVVVNSICLTAAIFYLLIHALFIAVLLYYQRDLHWRSMLIIIGSAVILFCSVALGGVCLGLLISWYKYIVYMNDGEKCYCLALCVSIVKGEREQPPRAQEYAMREAGRNDITYNEPPINNFSSF